MKQIRIVLADDHPIVLAGIRMLIESSNELELVGEATDGSNAFELILATSPDIAILDISLPGMNGILLARRVREQCPFVGVILLTAHEERSYIDLALEAGARGYVLKRSTSECLTHAIRGVHVGGLYIDPAVASGIFDTARTRSKAASGGRPALTDREADVLKMVAAGQTNRYVAEKLQLSEKSIETYRARASKKIGAASRSDIVRYATAQGWLTV